MIFITFLKCCFLTALLALQFQSLQIKSQMKNFAKINGTHFVANGKRLYLHGFNSYWMMYMASDPSTRDKVTSVFQQASKYGLNIVRTWAFNDGGNDRPLQISPGSYNEETFKGLDYVITEAKKCGIYVILCLVNNFKDFGGKPQYVKWARERGQQLTSDDDFYTNPLVKEFYKNHVKTVLARINTVSGVAYKDDPTIFAWELINEPRSNDPSGTQIQNWIGEMAAHVKSIDSEHLLEIGLEGFYGETKKQSNPNSYVIGTDFIANNQIPNIDFTTIHLYPEAWLPNSSKEEQDGFVDSWIQTHINDSDLVLRQPLVIAEFGKSSRLPGYALQERDNYFEKIYNDIYTNVKNGGPFTGALFWQLMAQGMESWGDGYDFVLENSPSTANVIKQQSRKLSSLS